jgi:hypothetical protein
METKDYSKPADIVSPPWVLGVSDGLQKPGLGTVKR